MKICPKSPGCYGLCAAANWEPGLPIMRFTGLVTRYQRDDPRLPKRGVRSLLVPVEPSLGFPGAASPAEHHILHIDASAVGNESRFINDNAKQSPPKDANVEFRIGFDDNSTGEMFIGVYTTKSVRAGEEFLASYDAPITKAD